MLFSHLKSLNMEKTMAYEQNYIHLLPIDVLWNIINYYDENLLLNTNRYGYLK